MLGRKATYLLRYGTPPPLLTIGKDQSFLEARLHHGFALVNQGKTLAQLGIINIQQDLPPILPSKNLVLPREIQN